ncbi:hypothetical protein G9P44_006119 [Scheffersomyces stipitis]|nr:hypothetical protein G9P44_006119 [Scheffersomyces stipitis]
MRAQALYDWSLAAESDNWVLNLEYYAHNQSFISSSSNGSLHGFSVASLSSSPYFSIPNAHESSINSIKKIDDFTLASCSTDGVKVWDLRAGSTPVHTLTNTKNSNFLSLGYGHNLLAGGTELVGVDAELHIWDLRNPTEVVRSFVDSHHDDITCIEFHPTISNYLMSGSTDGYVNIYDLNEKDEDDALHQVINFASVHSCHFTGPKRISILSHMETLAFYELNDTNYEVIAEPEPNDLGDVRSKWPDCEYIVDLNTQGYVGVGANSQRKFSLFPFDIAHEKIDLSRPTWFADAHGEEIVRDLVVIPNTRNALTCGEDGHIRLWEMPYELEIASKSPQVAEEGTQDIEVDSDSDSTKKEKKEKHKKHKKEKKEKKDKEKKEKKEKKDKKDKKDKKKKKSDVRFKPY